MPLRLSVGVTPVLRLLGPVRWETAAGQLDLGTVKQRTVLAALAVESGRLVAWAELVDRVWDGASSTGSHRALYTYVSRIRRLLEALDGAADHGGPVRLARRSGGYLLHLDPDEVDLHRFHRLAAAADDSRCPDGERARLLSEALALWHGRPLADLPGDWAARNREAWCRRRLDVMVAWAEARVRLGEPAAVIGPVQELAAEYPLAEPPGRSCGICTRPCCGPPFRGPAGPRRRWRRRSRGRPRPAGRSPPNCRRTRRASPVGSPS